jgi:HK97 family phage portal protein
VGLIDRIRRGPAQSNSLAALLNASETSPRSFTGVAVTEQSALRIAAVYAAVRVLSEAVASLPFPIYRQDGRSRLPVRQDPRWRLLNDTPNPEQTAFDFWAGIVTHVNLWGNGYAYVEPALDGSVAALWHLPPDRTRPVRLADGSLRYTVRPLDGSETFQLHPEDILHIRALSLDGDLGLSPIALARQTLGVALAAEEYEGRLFANDASPGIVIEWPGKLTGTQHAEFMRRWNAGHRGLERKHLLGVLTGGAKLSRAAIPPRDAEFLELRKLSVREIARIFRVPPYLLADLEPGAVSYASVEQQSLDFDTHSLRPLLVRIEQAVRLRLFDSWSDHQASLYPEFKVDGLLRGDTKTRYHGYALGRQWGWLSVNDIRELENQPGIGPLGDQYHRRP